MNDTITTKTKLRTYLDERGIRYSFVAGKLGISNGHLNHVLDGKRPLTDNLARKLGDLFDEPITAFTGDVE